jgi:hypothetical protein
MARYAKGHERVIVHEGPAVNGGLCLDGDVAHPGHNLFSALVIYDFFPLDATHDDMVQRPLIPHSTVWLVEYLVYWLNLELAIRLRLIPDSAAWTASFR